MGWVWARRDYLSRERAASNMRRKPSAVSAYVSRELLSYIAHQERIFVKYIC